jgi:phosphoribosyl 1,2-cyclic phosphodiesterase
VAPERQRVVHLLLTHLHLDHIEGLWFFAPLWDPETEVHLWGPPSWSRTLAEWIEHYFRPPMFPLPFADIPSTIVFHDVEDGARLELGGLRITAGLVTHPGPTLGYRIESESGSFAYVPDHEPARTPGFADRDAARITGTALAAGVDLLFHDGQYREDEYTTRVGWGHATVDHAVAFAKLVGAGSLVLFHHDPAHVDTELERMLAHARAVAGGSLPVELAYEGMERTPAPGR